jgi:glycosyltransferase involved in cell wall biosynthesis
VKSSFNIVGAIENKEYAKRVTDRITGNVKFIENVPYKQMGDIYAQTDVLLHPSWIDAAPLVIAEAAANNIPSVITDHVGSTYIVRDKESGFVIPVDNAEVLKEKIMWFIDNPEQIEIMGEKANQYYRETSKKEVFKIRWLQLIEKVLSE